MKPKWPAAYLHFTALDMRSFSREAIDAIQHNPDARQVAFAAELLADACDVAANRIDPTSPTPDPQTQPPK